MHIVVYARTPKREEGTGRCRYIGTEGMYTHTGAYAEKHIREEYTG